GAEANQHIFDRCCAEILRSKHFGMVGIETELRLALLILPESEKVADSGAAVCAVHPIAGRLPAEPGRLGSLGEGLAGADQRFDVDTVVHGSGRYGHRSLLWLVALSETSPSGSNEKLARDPIAIVYPVGGDGIEVFVVHGLPGRLVEAAVGERHR